MRRCFFQVIGRLHGALFILPSAVGVNLSGDGLSEDDHHILIKVYAYLKGPLFLELVLRYLRFGIRVPDRFDQASRADLEELVRMLEIKAVILARVLPFAKSRRAHRVWGLAQELKTCLASVPAKVVVTPKSANFMDNIGRQPPLRLHRLLQLIHRLALSS
jgi:hypothetical protein